MLELRFIAFSNRPAHYFVSGVSGASRFSRVKFPCVRGSQTSQSPRDARISRLAVLPSAHNDGVGTLISKHFAAQYPARMYPCQRFVSSLATVHA